MDIPEQYINSSQDNNTNSITNSSTKEYKTNWSNNRRKHWNEYMRNYNARKKQEYIDNLSKITMEFQGSNRTYEKDDITEILNNTINIYVGILNANMDKLPEDAVDKIKGVYKDKNILNYINILQIYIKGLFFGKKFP